MTRLRAWLAVSVLVGFFVTIVAAIVLPVVYARDLGALWGRLLLTLDFFFAATVALAFVRVAKMGRDEPVGLELTPERAPWLWQAVRELAAGVGTRAPDRLFVVPEVNASVSERARLLGLLGGPRTLTIGLPLLQVFTVAQLRAVLGHEMGHYSHNHTRLGPVVYRGVVAMHSVIYHVGPKSIVGRLMNAYATVYLLFAASVRRRQEIEADHAAARLAGATALSAALRELPGLDALWQIYLDRYVGPRWWAGAAPDRVAGAFPALVAARPAVRFDAPLPPEAPSRWDSHPSIADRIAHLSTLTFPPVAADDRPASVLLPNLETVADGLDDVLFRRAGHTLLPWTEYSARAASARGQVVGAEVLGEFARLAGASSVTAANLLDAVGTPLFDQVAGAPTSDPDRPARLVAMIVADAAVRSGVASWRHSWSAGPVELVAASGDVVDFDGLGRRLANPHTTRAARAELAALGVRLETVVGAAPRNDQPPAVIGLIGNVAVDGNRRDLIIYNLGFLVLPGSSRTRMAAWQSRLSTIAQQPLETLADNRDHRYLPFDQVARCVRTKTSVAGRVLLLTGGLRTTTNGQAFAFELTMRDGRTVKMRWGMETEFAEGTYSLLESCIDTLESGN